EREAHAHERIDAADQDTGGNELGKCRHLLGLELRQGAKTAGTVRAGTACLAVPDAIGLYPSQGYRLSHAGSGTMLGSWVASFGGNTCSLPLSVHCHTPIEARRF